MERAIRLTNEEYPGASGLRPKSRLRRALSPFAVRDPVLEYRCYAGLRQPPCLFRVAVLRQRVEGVEPLAHVVVHQDYGAAARLGAVKR